MRGEFQFIENLKSNFNLNLIGDDCAILPKNDEYDLLITSDVLVENIDFQINWNMPKALGYKCLAVSLSDIASMGGIPRYFLVTFGITKETWNSNLIDRFYEGIFELASVWNVTLVGGDISSVTDSCFFETTVLGEIEKGKAIRRSTANPGDLIYVSGELGGAAAGLKVLGEGMRGKQAANLIKRQLYPQPRVDIGRQLLESQIATAMIDISDGLSGDLRRICAASNVGANIYSANIPIDKNISNKLFSRETARAFALNGGEDFELLFTVSVKDAGSKHLEKYFCIGEITAAPNEINFITGDNVTELDTQGFTHF